MKYRSQLKQNLTKMTRIHPANLKGYKQAVALLAAGQPVALPTETVYGIAARADNDEAVANVFKLKNRSRAKPLSVCIFTPSQAEEICEVSPLARALMDIFWPGPLTLIMPKKCGANISHLAHLNTPAIGLRCPDINWRQGFLKLGFCSPLILTSANISGQPNPRTPQKITSLNGASIPLILDGGPSKTGIGSTIIAVSDDHLSLLRVGALPPERLAGFAIDTASP